MLFPALRFKKESLGRDFCVCGVVDGAWQHGESYMIGECVKIYKKISQEGHF